MLQDASVTPALQVVAKDGFSEEARDLASAALAALSDRTLTMLMEGQKHVMLSCELTFASLARPTYYLLAERQDLRMSLVLMIFSVFWQINGMHKQRSSGSTTG